MKVSAIILLLVPVIFADITKRDYPPEVKECLNAWGDSDATQVTGESAASSCYSTYSWINKGKLHPYTPDNYTAAYIQRVSANPLLTREKRGTFPTGRPRRRKEYRLMTRTQRTRYHTCMNILKNTNVPGTGQSRYDAIAAIHNFNVAGAAHGGVNFLSWHRVYLYTLENALREVHIDCAKVTLPYWDCTAEYYANQVEFGAGSRSIIFSEQFAGNADGQVVTGPFSSWGLVRNAGNAGGLFGREAIDSIKTRSSHAEITLPFAVGGFNRSAYNLEFYHNGIHVYLGGLLLDISLAPRDPLFFLLHAYIDFIWEEFRQSLLSRGIDAEVYPPWSNPRHAPNLQMEGFPEWTNVEGYSNQWYERVARYKPSFHCEREKKCRRGPRRNRWISCQTLSVGRRCTTIPVAEGNNKRRRRQTTTVQADSTSTYPTVQVCDKNSCPYTDASIQNVFSINDVINSNQWVYIAVHIIYERPNGLIFNTYNAYSEENGQFHFSHTEDTYDPSGSEHLHTNLYTGQARTYDSCRISASGTSKVYVRAEGINYSGTSVEYAIIDDRLPVMAQKAFIPIKDPINDVTEACLLAYDECGRICLPTCLVEGSSPSIYKPCTGCIRVDSTTPKRYGHTIAEVIANHWAFHDVHDEEYICPAEEYGDLYMKFVCDSSFKLPWQRLHTT